MDLSRVKVAPETEALISTRFADRIAREQKAFERQFAPIIALAQQLGPIIEMQRQLAHTRQVVEASQHLHDDLLNTASMQVVRQIERDIERTRRLAERIRADQLRIREMAEFDRANTGWIQQARIDRILDAHFNTWARDWLSESPAVLPPMPTAYPEIDPAEAPATAPTTYSITTSHIVTYSTALRTEAHLACAPPGRIAGVWRELTKKGNRGVSIALISASAAIIPAAAAVLTPDSVLTFVTAIGVARFLRLFFSRVAALMREGKTEPEAFRQACREFFGPHLPGE